MSIETQYLNSNLSVTGRLGIDPAYGTSDINNAYWGFRDPSNIASPVYSQLHGEGFSNPYGLGYSVDGTPNIRLLNFTKDGVTSVKKPSRIDELDKDAPQNYQVGAPVPNGGPVVSQIYKSSPNEGYRSKGPREGRY